MKKDEYIGWVGGSYDKAGLCETKENSKRGYMADDYFYEIFLKYDEKKVKIIVEVIEE